MRFEEGLLKCRRKSLIDGSCKTCNTAEMCRERLAKYESERMAITETEERKLIESENKRVECEERADMMLEYLSALRDVLVQDAKRDKLGGKGK